MATLVGSTGDDNLIGFGSHTFAGLGGNDIMTGGNGDDQFDFDFGTITGAASGVDIMVGGNGNDTYYVDDIADQVVEVSAFGGTDSITANVSYTLSANVENLTLDTGGGNGTGNALDNTITGNASDNTLDGGAGIDTLDGGSAGDDVYVIDNVGDVIIEVGTIDTEIDGIISSITVDMSVVGLNFIENLTLTGTAAINGTGNAWANTMIGNAAANVLDAGNTFIPASLAAGFGDDYLDGGAGADQMIGGDGSDIYVVDNVNDFITEFAPDGTDLVKSSITIDLRRANYDFVENCILTGTKAINAIASDFGNAITGNSAVNTITGGLSDDIIDGGGGADRLVGGDGDDTYVVDNTNDAVIEGVGEGSDTVLVFANYTLGSNVEALILGGSALVGTGNTLDNTLVGNNLANTLNGMTGADSMAGGDGDDVFFVDNAGDFVDEILNQGTDTVRFASSVAGTTYTLTTFVENLVLLGTTQLNGTGNTFGNTITGNSAANTLDGATGVDTLIGGNGNDVYIVDEVNDVVIESSPVFGTDTVLAVVSYTLGDNVENLDLSGATNDVDGTGNASANAITGNAFSNTLDGGAGADNLQGGLGDDYYIVDSSDVVTDTGGIDTIEASASVTASAGIENIVLTGTANINATGSDADVNTITGNDGNNTIDGGALADTMAGGAGDDTYIVDDALDVIIENLAEGTDSVRSDVAYTLAAEVENLTLTAVAGIANGTGNASDNVITGNASANVLTGLAGNDTLDGGAGADTMVGGTEDDTYTVDNIADTVTENAAEGTDTINSSVSFDLSTNGVNVENLTLTGALAINGTGDAGDNTITGNSAANVLTGGAGNDTYFVGAGDTVSELIGGGTDTIVTTATFVINPLAEVENLTLAGVLAINGTGDNSNNVITGNAARNVLTGLGGADTLDGGASGDTMIGGLGNDLYIVDSSTDVVTEVAGQGTDEVQSSVTFTLLGDLENLTLTGVANVNGTGNALVNVLNGNNGDNTLDGGAGNDFLLGGLGNDTYVIDSLADAVVDAGGTTDTLRSSITVSLAAYVGIENLVLTGTAAINGTGDGGNNTLTGNSAVNILTGGLGDDTYIMNSDDTAVEGVGEGTDTLIVTITSGTFVVPANFENIILVGTGNVGLTGDAGSNTFTGNNGANTLDGGGGADLLSGGLGSDVYIVDDIGDVVNENPGQGTDTIRASTTFTLSANVENLVLTGTANIDGTGNGGDNIITGNSGNNTLDGGTGTDRLVGGLGDDSYIIDNNRDVIVDTGGHDTVYAPYSYTLAASLEDLVLTGTSDLKGTGNGVANAITGNDGDNLLSGLAGNDILTGGDGDDSLVGGLGLDNMIGGDGDDAYFIDNAGDVVVELTGEGSDIVTLGVSYVFDPTAEIEFFLFSNTNPLNLTATDTDNFILGNVSANRISALDGEDVIFGGGGADSIDAGAGDDTITGGSGQDTIRGGAGEDTFIMLGGFATGNVADIIQDFNITTDNDVLDIKDFLSAYDPLNNVLTDFVRILDSGGNSLVQVDANGTTLPGGFITIAILQGITGLTGEQALVDSGNLIVS